MGTVQHFRQTKELTTAVMENLQKSQKEWQSWILIGNVKKAE